MTVTFGDPRLPPRFWAKVRRSNNGCWHWTGWVSRHGYGQFAVTSRNQQPAHRWAFHVLVQPLPAKRGEPGHLQVDHQCHNRTKSCVARHNCLHRRCVNPAHLRAVTGLVNSSAGRKTTQHFIVKTHCMRNHEFTPENTYRTAHGSRQCRRCQIDQSRENRRRKAATREREPHYQTIKTECPYGHPYSGDNLVLRADGARACRACLKRRSAEHHERKLGRVGIGHQRDRTHCIHGHPLAGDNLYVGPRDGKRACRTCRRARQAKSRSAA